MIDVYIVHNDPKIKDRIMHAEINSDAFYHFIDEGILKDKNKAYKLKNEWSAKKTPFVAIYEKDKMIKGFYSEADSDVIDSLIKYLNKN